MHYRFFKRFLVSAIFFILCGFLLISKWGARIKSIGLIGKAENAAISKVKRLASGSPSSGDQYAIASFDEEPNDDVTHHAPTGWIQNVLDKNLSREETASQLIKEIDKHIPHSDEVPNAYSPDEVLTNTVWEVPKTAKSSTTATGAVRPTVAKYAKRKVKKRRRPNRMFAGYLNMHVWQAWCGSSVQDLRRNKHFPLYPDYRTTTDELYVHHGERSYGQRIYGFLHPPKTGQYTFLLTSDDNSELWLSRSSSPDEIRKIAWLGNGSNFENAPVGYFHLSPTQTSKKIHLTRGKKYFIEVLHKQNAFSDHVLVAWKGPGLPRAKKIVGRYLSAYIDEFEMSSDVNVLAEFIPETKASFPTHLHGTLNASPALLKNISDFGSEDHRDHFHLTPFIEDSDIAGILPRCRYNPSYLVNFEVNRYEGVYLIHETAVFPDDKTELSHMIPMSDCEVRNRDSHRNVLRPTESTGDDSDMYPDDRSASDVQTKSKASQSGTFKLGSSFDSLLGKLKKRFKDFNSYIKSNVRIFGGNKDPDSVYSRSSRRGLRPKLARQRVDGQRMKNKSEVKSEKQKAQEKVNRGRGTASQIESNPRKRFEKLDETSRGDDNLPNSENSPKKKLEKKKDSSLSNGMPLKEEKERQNNFDNDEEEEEDDDFINADDKVLIGRNGFVRLKSYKDNSDKKSQRMNGAQKQLKELEDAERQVSQEGSDVLVQPPFEKQPADDVYEAKSKGRKLLSVNNNKNFVDASETDNEGLPSTWNNPRRSKPIFVPIAGIENVNKSLPTMSPTRSRSLERIFRRREVAEESQPFEMKSYYKRFNITSSRDVVKQFRVFKYAFYDMIKDLPRLHSWKFHQDVTSCKSDGNLRLNEKVGNGIVDKYMRALKQRHGDKYVLKKVINVEENHDVINGDRYLIELDLKVKGQGEKSVRLSRYVYQKLGNTNICEPEGFQWNRHSTVHVIVPVKNQGRWVQHFIDNMEKIYLETLDPHLSVIIVDFNSSDIDIERSLKNSKLKRYKLIKLEGPFQRALGIQAGADFVKNPHDIIFTCDLHLEIPSALIDSIRKHCVEGRMAFAPIVVRLDCGYLPENPYGLWELQGYGLFAICKSDFDRAGGMNTKEFKTKWGGEDWEMLDRILSNKIEVERLRIPKFYHYFHSKKGMWQRS